MNRRLVKKIPSRYKGFKVEIAEILQPVAAWEIEKLILIEKDFADAVKKFGIPKRLLEGILEHEIAERKISLEENISPEEAHEKLLKSKKWRALEKEVEKWVKIHLGEDYIIT